MAMMVPITILATATIRHTSAIAPITITVLGKPSRNPGPLASTDLGAIGKRELPRERCVRVASHGDHLAAVMMGMSQVYIEKRSATFSVIPAAQAKSETVGLSRLRRLP